MDHNDVPPAILSVWRHDGNCASRRASTPPGPHKRGEPPCTCEVLPDDERQALYTAWREFRGLPPIKDKGSAL